MVTIILKDLIEESRSIPEFVDRIGDAAKVSRKIDDLNFAAGMKRAHLLTSDTAIKKRMVQILNSINDDPVQKLTKKIRQDEVKERKKIMKAEGLDWYSVCPRTITASCRVKSAYSSAIKLLLLQEEAKMALQAGKPPRPDFLNDLYACRLIVEDNGDIESIGHCFDLMNETLTFLLTRMNCNLLVSSGTVKTSKFEQAKHPTVLLPTADMEIREELKSIVKDYFHDPKANGYQALHACVCDIETSFIFEIQITTRTAFKYVNASDDDNGSEVNEDNVRTSHGWHKNEKYGRIYEQQGVLDLTKIRMDGFYYNAETGQLKDTIMLIHPGILPSYL